VIEPANIHHNGPSKAVPAAAVNHVANALTGNLRHLYHFPYITFQSFAIGFLYRLNSSSLFFSI
jgi:hypothetical protein